MTSKPIKVGRTAPLELTDKNLSRDFRRASKRLREFSRKFRKLASK